MIDKLGRYTYGAATDGPHLLILGAIHGNEQCGTYALSRLKFELDNGLSVLEAGRVTLVPVCNPAAYKENKRFLDKNLNRIISPYAKGETLEHGYARQVVALIKAADFVLDLHSYPSGKLPFVFLDYPTQANFDFARALGVGQCVTGWPELFKGQTDLSEGDTLTYAFAEGKVGGVVECGRHTDPASIAVADQCIRNALSYLGLMASAPTNGEPTVSMAFHQATSVIVKGRAGRFSKAWEHLDVIHQGDCIASYDDGTNLVALEDGVMLLPNETSKIGEEWFYLGQKVEKPTLRLG